MFIATFQHAHDFLKRTETTLMEHEAANGLMLGIAFRLRNRPDIYGSASIYIATVEDEDGLILAALMTPPFNLILYAHRSDYTDALQVLLQDLISHQWSVPGVSGPTRLAADFSRAWEEQTGISYTLSVHERVFELHTVYPPQATPGKLRLVTPDDLHIIKPWIAAFFAETHLNRAHEEVDNYVHMRMSTQDFYVWELPDGQPVSLAGKTRPIISVISIGPVYTPPEQRGKGYASNIVAALSQHLLDQGWKSCSLFTDLANPTSNSIYQKIGYNPLLDWDEYHFNS